ncbi:group II intron reverse transcriptase/maturase [Nostoc sp. ChiQUE01b]|uniref:group II intron reverse transcriptase/maturase n=1 Tax=Nostoc sp. ChiQUE01b TaxID=3075376 RepID=UPI002AD2F4D5|nr:group II intron reverse transcriptase/maturase [Nostoc sp. ChiQUE01b]MDZ8259032.1 group II intron reverse transcriptase/maturase [Nostoc sp. ChiQUE01b]
MSKAEQQFRIESELDTPKTHEVDPNNWQSIPWKKLARQVYKLQKRIYQAANREDLVTVRQLQKTLLNSWSAKCIAVRKVTQDNQGKKTAGIDGVKLLAPDQRMHLVKSLKLNGKVNPVRRVWIPKPGTQEKRPLGIPTMYDRALQALVKMALEPEWEARFEPNSYGFRPGRSVHDAIQAIYLSIKQKAKYVLDAEICKCFERINHQALLAKLNTFPSLHRQIKAWLTAGILDGGNLFPNHEGTPQGGVISPLLANIALHGLENHIQLAFPRRYPKINGKKVTIRPPILIRYADDFVVLHEDISIVQRCQILITDWLKGMGLELKPSKTSLTHTFNEYEGKVGFDFLGFNIRQYQVGDYRSAKNPYGQILGFKTLITPSKDKLEEHLKDIGKIIDTHSTAPQQELINKLNPVIRGWANFYSSGVSRKAFSKADFLTYQKLRAWATNRCTHSNKHEIANKYWRVAENDLWCFSTPDGCQLAKHCDTRIIRHIKVQGSRSPYDGNWVYWSSRMGHHPEVPTRIASLLKKQQGKCTHCGLFFQDGDLMEVDHIIPKSKGGRNSYNNFQLLHRHCHDTKTARDASFSHTVLTQEYIEVNPF